MMQFFPCKVKVAAKRQLSLSRVCTYKLELPVEHQLLEWSLGEKQGCPLLPADSSGGSGNRRTRAALSSARYALRTGAAVGGHGMEPKPERGPGKGRGSSALSRRVCALLRN